MLQKPRHLLGHFLVDQGAKRAGRPRGDKDGPLLCSMDYLYERIFLFEQVRIVDKAMHTERLGCLVMMRREHEE